MATKINTGIYEFEANGKTYQVERDAYGLWVLYEMVAPCGGEAARDYCQDFRTKRAAIEAARRG